MPVEIAPEWLDAVAARVSEEVPGVPIMPVVADFTRGFGLPAGVPRSRRLGFFPGSTIGNFEPTDAADLLRRFRTALGPGARLLLGADLVKDRATLEAAYDDAAGVTAAFNLNLLHRLNRELGADFDVSAFRHRAVWNAEEERVEMHLESTRAQRAHLGGREIRFRAGETIHTENSHKYRPERLEALGRGRRLEGAGDVDRPRPPVLRLAAGLALREGAAPSWRARRSPATAAAPSCGRRTACSPSATPWRCRRSSSNSTCIFPPMARPW